MYCSLSIDTDNKKLLVYKYGETTTPTEFTYIADKSSTKDTVDIKDKIFKFIDTTYKSLRIDDAADTIEGRIN